MWFSISRLGILLYVIPALSSFFVVPMLGYSYSSAGGIVIFSSALAAILGYVLSALIPGKEYSNSRHPSKSYLLFSYILMAVGILSSILNHLRIGSIPLLSGNQSRVELQNSILWNIYILCSVGIFIFSFASIRHKPKKIGWQLLVGYLILALASAWKGVLVNFLFLYFLPRFKNSKISILTILLAATIFAAMFLLINGLRGGDFLSTLSQPIFYIYWGFVNFDSTASFATSSCLHSLPLIGCKFSVDDSDLIVSTWNVYTALSPIYIDGGLPLVIGVFFFFGFLSGFFEKSKNRLVFDYLQYVAFYFFFLAHNGYIFYSSVYFSALFIILVVEHMSKYFKKIPRPPVRLH